MVKIGNVYRWIHGRITGKPTNFKWIIKGKVAGSGVPMSANEVKWLVEKQGIRSIVTIKEKPLQQQWFSNKKDDNNNSANSSHSVNTKIDYLHISTQDYGAPSLEELDYVVNYINQQIDRERPVLVHCSGGKGRTGTILAAYLIKKENGITAEDAIRKLSNIRGESIQSKDQERIVFNYEKYIKSQTRNNVNNNNNN
jgi:atypical dual specificity phosphatase